MSFRQTFIGKTAYYPDYQEGPHLLVVSILCYVEETPGPFRALLDTGSQWCILPSHAAEDLGIDVDPDPFLQPLLTRFGPIQGRLERVRLTLAADEGVSLEFEATCFVSEDWPGPMVIGWKGGLERFRFALDPGHDLFYFGPL